MTVPMSSSPRRDIPYEFLLEVEELKSMGEPDTAIAPYVHEQEQTYG
jgi:hypothetical protein